MEHVVFYQSTQGTPAFRRVASLDDAVSFAEHLRNVESVTDFSVYALSPVTLSLRAYYHVEVSGAGDGQQTPTNAPQVAEAPAAPEQVPPPLPAEPPSAEAPSSEAGPSDSGYVSGMPFAAAPPAPPSSDSEEVAPAAESTVVDPNVVDPTVEEVVPSGRRSMGFFARS